MLVIPATIKLWMRPSHQPKALIDHPSSTELDLVAHLKGIECPQGSVPIQRTQKEDIIREKYFSRTRSTIHPHSNTFPGQHYAYLMPSVEHATYYGVSADISLHSLQLGGDQHSSAQMWIENGPPDQRTSLQAGWMVAPALARNNDTRMFIFWTKDNSKTGCYNHLCREFVQVHKTYGPGSHFTQTSTYGGIQYAIQFAIFQDGTSGNWWLQCGNVSLGYWPKIVVPQLSRGASAVAWGGLAAGSPTNSPPMGNGHFPDNNFQKACFIKRLRTLNAYYRSVSPDQDKMKNYYVDNNKCYALEYLGYRGDMEISLLFGGPGGNCGD